MEIYFYSIKMSEQTLKFGANEVNKKEFHASKQAIALNLVDINRPLCIILPQMSGYIKYSESGGKSMSYMIEDDSVLVKYMKFGTMLKRH